MYLYYDRRLQLQIRMFIGHRDRIFHVTYSSDGDYLLSASADGTFNIWDAITHRSLYRSPSVNAEYLRASWSNEATHGGRFISCCRADGKCEIYDVHEIDDIVDENDIVKPLTLIPVLVIELTEEDQIYGAEFIKFNGIDAIMLAYNNDLKFLSLDDKRELLGYNFAPRNDVKTVFGGERNPDQISFIFDAKLSNQTERPWVAVALSDGTCHVVQTTNNQCIANFPVCEESHLSSIAWNENVSQLFVGDASGILYGYSTNDWSRLFRVQIHQGPVFGISIELDAESRVPSAWTWSADCSLQKHAIPLLISGTPKEELDTQSLMINLPGYPIYSVALHQTQGLIAIGGGFDSSAFIGIPIYEIVTR